MNICSMPVIFHVPVTVFRVRFVGVVGPRCSAPLSTYPPAATTEPLVLARWLAPALTVKLARLMSKGLREATEGEPVKD